MLTGTAAHLSQLVEHAQARGLTLRTTGLFRSGTPVAEAQGSDSEVYAALGLSDIPPELRLGTDEIERAAQGAIPALLTVPDIRGDLHMHSDWSDGHDPIEAMTRAAVELGYEYIAITDHSPHAETRRTVDADRLRRQADEIRRVQQRVQGITILHGVEVDILPDGDLDLDDAALEPLDIVVASLHDRAGQGRDELTARYLRTMRHPFVNIIAQPDEPDRRPPRPATIWISTRCSRRRSAPAPSSKSTARQSTSTWTALSLAAPPQPAS